MPQAMVIGADQYADGRIPSLKCSANDAEEVSKRLASAGFEVVTLINEDATRKEIDRELEIGLNERIRGEDEPVLIYWAGHGMTDLRESANPNRAWSTFLLPYDTDLDQLVSSAFPVQKIRAMLDGLRSRRVLVLLDTCFSGAIGAADGRGFVFGGRGGQLLDKPDDFLKMEGHGCILVSACGPNEAARESLRHGHGFFTKAVLEVLDRGVAPGDRTITVPALTSEIRAIVPRETRNAQTPSQYGSFEGTDWSIPLPPPAPYQPPMPSWAFVGTAGGVGKTTLAMMTAELLAEAGNNVLYLDADITNFGGTSTWLQRTGTDIYRTRTFADHVAAFSRTKIQVPPRQLSDDLLNVTPGYLRRYECGKIFLLPAARASDKLFVFELLADIKDRRANATCRQILDAAFDRGIRQGATCVVIDCGAVFDPLAVNCISAAHHPFVVGAARAGSRDQREIIFSNCAQTVEEFNRMRVETVVNRVPSMEALTKHWGQPGFRGPGMSYHWLPFDRKLFQNWEEGQPNFELGYDQLSHTWHEILVASDQKGCDGQHRDYLPTEWDRFSKWALWILNNPHWAVSERSRLSRALRWVYLRASVFLCGLSTGLTSLILHSFARMTGEGPARHINDPAFLPSWLAVTLMAIFGVLLAGSILRVFLLHRRRRVLGEVITHSVSGTQLKSWFSIPADEGPWWKVWKTSRRAAIEWLHRRIATSRSGELPQNPSFEVE